MGAANINEHLRQLVRPIGWFKPDPQNARKHDNRNIKAISDSLREFGQVKPVVCLTDGTVIAGNGTLSAARLLGWNELAAVLFSDVSKAKQYAIADNRTAELAEWDEVVLRSTLKELNDSGVDLSTIGFDLDVVKVMFEVVEDPFAKDEPRGEIVDESRASVVIHCKLVDVPRVKDALTKLISDLGLQDAKLK